MLHLQYKKYLPSIHKNECKNQLFDITNTLIEAVKPCTRPWRRCMHGSCFWNKLNWQNVGRSAWLAPPYTFHCKNHRILIRTKYVFRESLLLNTLNELYRYSLPSSMFFLVVLHLNHYARSTQESLTSKPDIWRASKNICVCVFS